jgi:hypothetical protein
MTDLLLALALTLVIEIPLGAILLKRKDSVIPLVLINVLTNPALNAILFLIFSLTKSYTVYFTVLTIGELAVFIGEGFLLHTLCDLPQKRALILSTIMNSCSLFLGSAMLSLI